MHKTLDPRVALCHGQLIPTVNNHYEQTDTNLEETVRLKFLFSAWNRPGQTHRKMRKESHGSLVTSCCCWFSWTWIWKRWPSCRVCIVNVTQGAARLFLCSQWWAYFEWGTIGGSAWYSALALGKQSHPSTNDLVVINEKYHLFRRGYDVRGAFYLVHWRLRAITGQSSNHHKDFKIHAPVWFWWVFAEKEGKALGQWHCFTKRALE